MGYPHPDHLLKRLTARQLLEWMEFDQLDPIGEERNEMRNGVLCSTIDNGFKQILYGLGDGKKVPEWSSGIDFMMFTEKPPERVYTPEELEAELDRMWG